MRRFISDGSVDAACSVSTLTALSIFSSDKFVDPLMNHWKPTGTLDRQVDCRPTATDPSGQLGQRKDSNQSGALADKISIAFYLVHVINQLG